MNGKEHWTFLFVYYRKNKNHLQLGDDMVRCRYHWCSRRIGLRPVPPDLKGGCSSGEFGVSFFFLFFFSFLFAKRERERERRGKSSVTTCVEASRGKGEYSVNLQMELPSS